LLYAAVSLALAACAAPAGPARVVATESALRLDYDAQMRAAIRDQAQRDHGAECGVVTVPDRAIIPIEVTGGGLPEYAVSFGRVLCQADGGPTTRWEGTGGDWLQFWVGGGGPPRIMLEQSMYGFSVEPGRVTAQQHGTFCEGGTGPNLCLVTYAWNPRTRRLEIASRRYFDGPEDGTPPQARYTISDLGR
jgi:hypothetical protein